ncbi:MAG: hypothetical protein M1828_001461 [Chrysothrix sp. TS-e1954]|nr:MAG: hypothetical protein M1828_001461 [Chrysothrix sp. TS-e1954]
MDNADNPILVLGAGVLGLPILRRLAHTARSLPSERRFSISVTLRPSNAVFSSPPPSTIAYQSSDKPSPPAALDATLPELIQHHAVTPIAIDLARSSHDTLVDLFSGYHTLISATGYSITSSAVPPPFSETEHPSTVTMDATAFPVLIAHAALAARVDRFLPWAFGLDYVAIGRGREQKVFDAQLDVRELLEAHTKEMARRGEVGTQWVIVPVGVFSDLLGSRGWGVVDVPRAGDGDVDGKGEGVLRALGSWDTPITLTTPHDIALGIAHILFPKPSPSPQTPLPLPPTIRLSTSTTTYAALASTVSSVLNRDFKRECWDLERIARELEGKPGDTLWSYRAVFARGVGTAWEVEGDGEEGGLELGEEADARGGLEGVVRGWFGL